MLRPGRLSQGQGRSCMSPQPLVPSPELRTQTSPTDVCRCRFGSRSPRPASCWRLPLPSGAWVACGVALEHSPNTHSVADWPVPFRQAPPGPLLPGQPSSQLPPTRPAPCLSCSGMNVVIYQGVVQGAGCEGDPLEVGVEADVSA